MLSRRGNKEDAQRMHSTSRRRHQATRLISHHERVGSTRRASDRFISDHSIPSFPSFPGGLACNTTESSRCSTLNVRL